ncbi:Sodium-dependent neutral amino acid transporter B(0)AT2-like, partial [Homarus americanus]
DHDVTRLPDEAGPGGRRRRSRHHRGHTMGRYDPSSEPITPTAPLSLEVEVGGYLPSGPRSLETESYAPSAPPILDMPPTTTTIPRPCFTSRSQLARRHSSTFPTQTATLSSSSWPGIGVEGERARLQGGTWGHSHSGLMASLAVTVTTFNISRFAVLGARFGWPFVVQWVVVSMVLGLPLMTFHMTGVGYSILVAQVLVGLYCCVPIAWLFIFFRDSFITHNNMFRWADCRRNQSYGKVCYIVFLLPLLCYLVVCLYLASWTKDDLYINDVTNFNEFFMNSRSWMAASREVFLVWGFHGAVLQQMAAHNKRGHALYRDTTIVSVITTLVLVLAAVTGSSCVSGLLQSNLHYKPSSFENAKNAQFLTESKVQHKMMPVFETFLKHPHMGNLPPQRLAEYMYHDNFYAGIRIRPPKIGSVKRTEAEEQSGYQSLRLATELFPALLAANGAQQISPFWSSLFYLSLLLFGIAQQLAVWRTIIEAVIRINRERLQAWETFITFLCCLFGFSAALPMATGAGIHILYFLDYVVSCGWWLMIIQLVQIFALLFVRGKPYSGQDIVSELMGNSEQCRSLWLGPLTSFAWNIIVPVGLLVLSISSFKSGQYRDVFAWGSDSYWPVWACQLASALQLFPILLVPLVGLIQTCRFLAATDDDLFERIQLLYRPTLRQRTRGNGSFLSVTEESDLDGLGGGRDGQDDSGAIPTPRPFSDPPPKYTPPPSYSTATGVRFAKLLNQSLRQSMRRLRETLRNNSEASTNRDGEGAPQGVECGQPSTTAATPYIPPPDYVTAVTECGTQRSQSSTSSDSPPRYSTLDPLRRQQALAALASAASSSTCIKTDDETELPLPTTPALHRNNSLRRSGLRRSIASGVRRSARRLAATLGVGGSEDGATLVSSEAPVSQDVHPGRETEPSHPYAFTNFELVSHSNA